MKILLTLTTILFFNTVKAQLFIAPGDSISVLPGTVFTLQEDLANNGRIYNNGVLVLNGSAPQNIYGIGNADNITVDNNTVMQSNCAINNVLQINAGKILSLGNYELLNSGSIAGTGMLSGSANASLVLSGNSSVLYFDQSSDAATNALKNFTINNISTTLQNKLYVYNTMQPSAGNITLNDEVVLRSNSSNTARVGITGSNIFYNANGKFVIERFIPGRRAWRLLTAPVTPGSNVKISDAWQDGKARVTNVNIISNPEPGYGTHVTFGYPSTNGYDQGVNGNPSIRYLNSAGWSGVPTATNDGNTFNSGIITDQPGYMLFVRGDRGTLLSQATGAATTPTVLRPKGRINTGTLDLPLSAGFVSGGSHFRVVGNPYPSSVNFHSIITNPVNSAAGLPDAFYLWDPTITGSSGVGGFVGMVYNAAASVAAGRPVYDRSVASSIGNSGDVQSSAAFVIDYSGPATTIRVQENDKTDSSNITFFRPAASLQTSLFALNGDSTLSLNDGVLLSVSDANQKSIDKNDLRKLGNFAENICIIKDGHYLCIEKTQPLTAGDTVWYFIKNLKQKRYELKIETDAASIKNGTAIFLEDLFIKSHTPLQVGGTVSYSFLVTSDTGSYSNHRFRLICKSVGSINGLETKLVAEGVALNWGAVPEAGSCNFTIQRSTDGINFEDVGTTILQEFTDMSVSEGVYFYRIQCVSSHGVVTYSDIRKVSVPNRKPGWIVYPNPVTGNMFTLYSKNPGAGLYHVRLMDEKGTIVLIQHFTLTGGTSQKQILLPALISDGIYTLEVNGPANSTSFVKLSVQQ